MKELDNVKTLVSKDNIQKGTVGTVVIYEEGRHCCLVEFCNINGDSKIIEFDLKELEVIQN